MITAKEANKQTKKNIENFQTEELRRINEMIEKSIADGCFYFTCAGCLSKNSIDILESLGYKITGGIQYNDAYYTISWKDEEVFDVDSRFKRSWFNR